MRLLQPIFLNFGSARVDDLMKPAAVFDNEVIRHYTMLGPKSVFADVNQRYPFGDIRRVPRDVPPGRDVDIRCAKKRADGGSASRNLMFGAPVDAREAGTGLLSGSEACLANKLRRATTLSSPRDCRMIV